MPEPLPLAEVPVVGSSVVVVGTVVLVVGTLVPVVGAAVVPPLLPVSLAVSSLPLLQAGRRGVRLARRASGASERVQGGKREVMAG